MPAKTNCSTLHISILAASGGYLNSRQHDGDKVVVREQQGTNYAAITHMLDDGWSGEGEQNVEVLQGGDCVQLR